MKLKALLLALSVLFLIGGTKPLYVEAQHVLNECIDFTPSTCPSAVKSRFLLAVEEYNNVIDPNDEQTDLTPIEVLWEFLRAQGKTLLVHKKQREMKAATNEALETEAENVDNDMPTAIPYCGDNVVNQTNEDCDGTDDSACTGMCAPDCQCPSPTTTTTTLP